MGKCMVFLFLFSLFFFLLLWQVDANLLFLFRALWCCPGRGLVCMSFPIILPFETQRPGTERFRYLGDSCTRIPLVEQRCCPQAAGQGCEVAPGNQD